MSASPSVAIVGGGISGLAAAFRLTELGNQQGRPLQVTLLEASHHLGGVISTYRQDGFLTEGGPDSFITDKPWALQLAERLGIQDRVIGTQDEYRRSFLVRRARLYPTPEGFHLLAPARLGPLVTTPVLSPLGKLRAGLDLLLPRRRQGGDETIGAFVQRRLGRQVLERMAQPMVTAIYGADPMELSLTATFPRFQKLEEKYGSIIRAMWTGARQRAAAAAKDGNAGLTSSEGVSGARYGLFATFDTGLQLLKDTLVQRLSGVSMRTGTPVEAVVQDGGRWQLQRAGGGESFDAVVVALPAPRAAELLKPLDTELARKLSFIKYGSSATVSLGYREEDVRHSLDGFGFVVPTAEGLSILGCTFAHRKYRYRAPEGYALLRAFHGDQSRTLSEQDLLQATKRDLDRLLGLSGEPVLSRVARYQQALPHYGIGHLELIGAIQERLQAHHRLALAGNAYKGIGLPDCVHSGETAAEEILDQLS